MSVYASAAHAEDSAAVAVIRRLQETYVAVLKQSSTLPYQGRYAQLAPVIGAAYDTEFMARAAIGRQWQQLSEADQVRWVKAFGDFTIANYAARLNHDSGQRFEVLGEQPAESETVMVLTRVVDPAAENVDLNYRMRETGNSWKIIDVYAKGTVSEVALRRADYAALLKEKGLDALIESVERKVADLAAGKNVE